MKQYPNQLDGSSPTSIISQIYCLFAYSLLVTPLLTRNSNLISNQILVKIHQNPLHSLHSNWYQIEFYSDHQRPISFSQISIWSKLWHLAILTQTFHSFPFLQPTSSTLTWNLGDFTQIWLFPSGCFISNEVYYSNFYSIWVQLPSKVWEMDLLFVNN